MATLECYKYHRSDNYNDNIGIYFQKIKVELIKRPQVSNKDFLLSADTFQIFNNFVKHSIAPYS